MSRTKTSTLPTPRSSIRRASIALAGVITLLLGFLPLALGTTSTSARAESFATTATLTNLHVENSSGGSEFTQWSRAKISLDWSLPDDAPTPAGFVIDLPSQLQGFRTTFYLLDDDDARMGTCVVATDTVTCTIDPVYLADHPDDVGGSMFFWTQVTVKTSESTEEILDFGEGLGQFAVVVDPPSGGSGTWNGGEDRKVGWRYSGDEADTHWQITMKGPADGWDPGVNFSLTDTLQGNQAFTDPVRAVVFEATSFNDDGTPKFVAMPTSAYDVGEPDGKSLTITWTSRERPAGATAGPWYQVQILSDVLDEPGEWEDYYQNKFTWTATTGESGGQQGVVYTYGGGGTGGGTKATGRFTLEKVVEGPASDLAKDATYKVRWSTPEGTNPAGDVVDLKVGDEPWVSPRIPKNVPVTIEEVELPTIAGVDWGPVTYNPGQTVIIRGGVTSPITITNTANPAETPPTTEPTTPPTEPTTPPTEPTTPSTSEAAAASGGQGPSSGSTATRSPAKGWLPSTGATISMVALAAALGMLIIGGLAVAAARRGQQEE